MKVYFAADHAGFELKNILLNFVRGELNHETQDCGAFSFDAGDDYPELIAGAASALSKDAAQSLPSRAIVIGASGQGEAMAANRFNGVRCALYYGKAGNSQIDMSGHELDMLASTRKHNDANALSLGARFISEEEAKEAVRLWLLTPFSDEERHARRVREIDTIA
jgi:ribose 5-phosphate isomerase B